MGDFQLVCDIVLKYFVISVCAKQNFAFFIRLLLLLLFCCCFQLGNVIFFHGNSVFYILSPALVLGDFLRYSVTVVWECRSASSKTT